MLGLAHVDYAQPTIEFVALTLKKDLIHYYLSWGHPDAEAGSWDHGSAPYGWPSAIMYLDDTHPMSSQGLLKG